MDFFAIVHLTSSCLFDMVLWLWCGTISGHSLLVLWLWCGTISGHSPHGVMIVMWHNFWTQPTGVMNVMWHSSWTQPTCFYLDSVLGMCLFFVPEWTLSVACQNSLPGLVTEVEGCSLSCNDVGLWIPDGHTVISVPPTLTYGVSCHLFYHCLLQIHWIHKHFEWGNSYYISSASSDYRKIDFFFSLPIGICVSVWEMEEVVAAWVGNGMLMLKSILASEENSFSCYYDFREGFITIFYWRWSTKWHDTKPTEMYSVWVPSAGYITCSEDYDDDDGDDI